MNIQNSHKRLWGGSVAVLVALTHFPLRCEAAVILTRPVVPPRFDNFLLRTDTFGDLDLDQDGQTDFVVHLTGSGVLITSTPGYEILGVSLSELGYAYPYGQYSETTRMRLGQIIGETAGAPGDWFYHGFTDAIPHNSLETTAGFVTGYFRSRAGPGELRGLGGWFNATDGYIAWRRETPGGYQYGWLRASIEITFSGHARTHSGDTFLFPEWAVETEPGVPILAGIPEPSSTALLLIAAATAWRRCRRPEASASASAA